MQGMYCNYSQHYKRVKACTPGMPGRCAGTVWRVVITIPPAAIVIAAAEVTVAMLLPPLLQLLPPPPPCHRVVSQSLLLPYHCVTTAGMPLCHGCCAIASPLPH